MEDKRSAKQNSQQSSGASAGQDDDALNAADNEDLEGESREFDGPREMIPGFDQVKPAPPQASEIYLSDAILASQGKSNFVAYTIKLPADQLAALQSIWLELKRLYGTHSPDKSGMIQQAIQDWLKRWDGPDRQKLLNELLEIRQDTRRRQYKK